MKQLGSVYCVLAWAAVVVLGVTGRKVLDADECVQGAAELAEAIQESPIQGNVTVCLDDSERYVLLSLWRLHEAWHSRVRHRRISSFQADRTDKHHEACKMHTIVGNSGRLSPHAAYRVCAVSVMSGAYLSVEPSRQHDACPQLRERH